MTVVTKKVTFSTNGDGHTIDITTQIRNAVTQSELQNGIVTVFVPGATAGLTTIEFESGAVQDLNAAIQRLAPENIRYSHDDRWHDGNGYSHVRSAFIGPDITIPFSEKELLLGQWQQIVFLDFDNRPRNRHVIVQIMGE